MGRAGKMASPRRAMRSKVRRSNADPISAFPGREAGRMTRRRLAEPTSSRTRQTPRRLPSAPNAWRAALGAKTATRSPMSSRVRPGTRKVRGVALFSIVPWT